VPNNPNPFDLELDGFYTSGIWRRARCPASLPCPASGR